MTFSVRDKSNCDFRKLERLIPPARVHPRPVAFWFVAGLRRQHAMSTASAQQTRYPDAEIAWKAEYHPLPSRGWLGWPERCHVQVGATRIVDAAIISALSLVGRTAEGYRRSREAVRCGPTYRALSPAPRSAATSCPVPRRSVASISPLAPNAVRALASSASRRRCAAATA